MAARLTALVLCAGIGVFAPDQPPADPREPTATTAPVADGPLGVLALGGIPVVNLESRLRSLGPSQPRAYFDLAEEVAAEVEASANPADARTLARQLFALSYVLDPQMGRAACLGLAALASAETEQRWLWALARAMDPRTAGPTWAAVRVANTSEPVVLDLCAVLGYARAGEGRRAEPLLARPGVSELLDRYDAMLSPAEIKGGADTIRRDIAKWPVCPECKNRRIVTKGGGTGADNAQAVVCHTCGGRPGPSKTVDELLLQLRLESALLNGIHRSWAAQAVADRGTPLRDLDPAELGPTFGVETAKCVWRDGEWVVPAR